MMTFKPRSDVTGDGGSSSPPANDHRAPERRTPRAAVPLGRLPTRLLYVEGDDAMRGTLHAALVNAGYDVTAAPNAEQALRQLGSTRFDIVVTDDDLLDETGGGLLERAAAMGFLRRTAAIVLADERGPAGGAGRTTLRKPVDFTVLLTAIGDALGQILPAAVVSLGAPTPAQIELVLYVTGTSQESHKAIRNLHRALKAIDARRFHLTICDVARGGDEAWHQRFEEDRVVVTPTLVMRTPGPKSWIVGSLTPIDAVQQMLSSALKEPDGSEG